MLVHHTTTIHNKCKCHHQMLNKYKHFNYTHINCALLALPYKCFYNSNIVKQNTEIPTLPPPYIIHAQLMGDKIS